MNFSKNEMIDMIFIIGEAQRNTLLASRLYKERYPERRAPKEKSLERLLQRFVETGTVEYSKPNKEHPVIGEENQNVVLQAVVDDPTISVRDISRQFDLGKSSVNKILKINHFHPYHIQKLQQLEENDFPRRMAFCQWAQRKIRDDPEFFHKIIFTDEATLNKSGNINQKNYHVYDNVNPHAIRIVDHQHRWSLYVWAGIVNRRPIGPFFFERTINGAMYLDFLQHDFLEILPNFNLVELASLWFQQDGAPAHSTVAVTNHLNDLFPNQWIGRQGPVQWPPRSPDLNPLDFFLWGFLKEEVYKEPPTTRENMRDRIVQCFNQISPEKLENVKRSFSERIAKCIDQNGGHFEHLL